MASNAEIRRLFNLYAELLQLHGGNKKLSGILSGAAFRIRRIDASLMAMTRPELSQMFRPEIVRLLDELKKSNAIADLDELIQLTPSGLFDMMRIKGLGGAKLSVLWKEAKIDSVDMLLEAAKAGKISTLRGFGKKTESNIIAAIDSMRSNTDRFRYASVAHVAAELELFLRKKLKTDLVCLCGEVRRQSTTVAAIELIAAAKKLSAAQLGRSLILQSSNDQQTLAHTIDEIPVIIYHTTGKNFYKELFQRTGHELHVKRIFAKLNGHTSFRSEEDVYKKAGLPFIVPELREDNAEWNFVKRKKKLVELKDITGVVHNHTTWSDGVDTLENFVQACIKKEFEYTVISDHSANAHYAGGLKEAKVLRQFEAIDELNKKVKPFRIFKSIECDILVSGELDYHEELWKQFDLVIVSVHQLLKMDEEKATKRLIKAIENPYTTILGHMTGRQLLIRPGYPVNFKKVIDACAANKVVIEINANPFRLDMDWSHIPYAMQKGVMISINPDAHSIGEIDNIRWGISAARKGGLTKDMTWNAMPLKKIVGWIKSKRHGLVLDDSRRG
jgi:DNA polymerase (family 10)